MSPVIAAPDMQRHARMCPGHGLDERLQAAIGADGLREPIGAKFQPRIGLARRPGTVGCARQGKDIQHRHQFGTVKLGIGVRDHRRRRRTMQAAWQKGAFDRPHESGFTGSCEIAGALPGMEILGIVAQRCAMQLRRGSRGRQRGNVVGDIELGRNCASSPRETRRLGIVRRGRQPGRNAGCPRTPGARNRPGCPRRHAGRQTGRTSPHDRPRHAGDNLFIEGPDKSGLVPGDHRNAVARAVQRIGLLDHPGVGRHVPGADDANRSAHQPALRGRSKARAIAEDSSAR